MKPPRAVLLYEELLLMLHEDDGDVNPVPSHRRAEILALMDEIRRAPEKEYPFDRFAASRGMDLEYFRRLFKQHTESSPVRYRIRQQLALAAHLLTSSDALVSEIAEQVGIPDEYHFSHLFRKRYGLPPGRFRHLLSFHEKRK